ncbi:hypothetical protein ABK040_008780 [Willaertia magna]
MSGLSRMSNDNSSANDANQQQCISSPEVILLEEDSYIEKLNTKNLKKLETLTINTTASSSTTLVDNNDNNSPFHLLLNQQLNYQQEQILSNSMDETFLKKIKKVWNYYRQENISKLQKEKYLFEFVNLINDFFDSNSDIHFVLPLYDGLDINELIYFLSLEFIHHFCDLFDTQITPSTLINYINEKYHLTTFISEMNYDKVVAFFFYKQQQESKQQEENKYSYEKSLCTLLSKTLCLLIESVNDLKIVKGLTSTIIICIEFYLQWIGLNQKINKEDNEQQYNCLKNMNYTLLSNIQEKLSEYIKVYFTNTNEKFKIKETLTTRDNHPCIILSNLLLQISKKGKEVFDEVFLETFIWKKLFLFIYFIFNRDNNNNNLEKKRKDSIYRSIYCNVLNIQFSNFIGLSIGNMFTIASKNITKLLQLSKQKVFNEMLSLIEEIYLEKEKSNKPTTTATSVNTSVQSTETVVTDDELSLQSTTTTTNNENNNETSSNEDIVYLDLLYMSEICVFILFHSIHIVPNCFVEFETFDGYEVLQKIFYKVTTKYKKRLLEDNANNSNNKSKEIFIQFNQEKMLTIIHVLCSIVLDLTISIQMVNQLEMIQSSLLEPCKHNHHMFDVLVQLYDYTDMNNLIINSNSIVNSENVWNCKKELLDHVLSILILFQQEYFDKLYISQPFRILCNNFTKTSEIMQIEVLRTFEFYIKSFCNNFEQNNNYVDLFCKAILREYCKLLLTNHLKYIDSINRICDHIREMIETNDFTTISFLLRKSNFTKIILKSIYLLPSQRNTLVMIKLVKLIYLFLGNNLDNHVDLMSNVKPKSNELYYLLFDEELILSTLDVIKIIVIADKDQQWDFIVVDLLDIMLSNSSNMYSNNNSLNNSDSSVNEKHLKMCEHILNYLHEIFIKNESVKNSFCKYKGYEKVIKLLYKFSRFLKKKDNLNEVKGEDNCNGQLENLVFRVVQSTILLLTITMQNNVENQFYFKRNITFSSLFEPLHICGFVKYFEYGIHLTMNLIQFSLMDTTLYTLQHITKTSVDTNTVMSSTTNNSPNFVQLIDNKNDIITEPITTARIAKECISLIEDDNTINFTNLLVNEFLMKMRTRILLFENPEIIPEVLLKLYGRNLNVIQPKLSKLFFQILLTTACKYSTNREKLTRAKSLLVLMKEFTKVLLDPEHLLSNMIIKLLLVLSQHNFSVREMQYYFSLFNKNQRKNDISHKLNKSKDQILAFNNLLNTLLEMSQCEYVPNYYIDFSPLNKSKIFRMDDLKQLKTKKRLFQSSSNKIAYDREERVLLKRSLDTISSILFPKLEYPHWPSDRGHTVTLWFRVESNRSGICLFSFSSHIHEISFNFCITPEMFITVEKKTNHKNNIIDDDNKNNSNVNNSNNNNNSEWSEIFTDFSFELDKWYFISINQQVKQLQDKVEYIFQLFINGSSTQTIIHEEKFDKSLLDTLKSFLNISQTSLEYVVLGARIFEINQMIKKTMDTIKRKTNALMEGVISSHQQVNEEFFISPAFQIGNMFFIEDCLNEEEIYMIYHLGPNYVGNFDEDVSQYFCNEIINEQSVARFKNKIYYMKDCSNNVGLSHLSNRLIFVFSAMDCHFVTRQVVTKSKQNQLNTFDSVDTVIGKPTTTITPIHPPQPSSLSSNANNTTNITTNNNTDALVVNNTISSSKSNLSIASLSENSTTTSTSSSVTVNTNVNTNVSVKQQPSSSPTTSTSTKTNNNNNNSNNKNNNKENNKRNIRHFIPNKTYNANQPIQISTSNSNEYVTIKCYLSGKTTQVRKCTFKSNLYVIGGMRTILGLYIKTKDPSSKIYILLLISYLMKFNSLNTSEMNTINGYDLLNYNLQRNDKDNLFSVTNNVLLTLFVMSGLDIPTQFMVQNNNSLKIKVKEICKRGLINNFMVVEKLLLDWRIWQLNAATNTFKKMLKCLSDLVTHNNYRNIQVCEHHRYVYLRMVNVSRRFLFFMSNMFITEFKFKWSVKTIQPIIKILKNIIPRPLNITSFFPFVQYVTLTHQIELDYLRSSNENKEKGTVDYNDFLFTEPRKSILTLLYNLMEEAPDDVLEDLHAILSSGQLIALLNNKSNLIRNILLKILGIYLTRKDNIRESFIKSNYHYVLGQILLEVNDPSLHELQVMFDLLIGTFQKKVYDEMNSVIVNNSTRNVDVLKNNTISNLDKKKITSFEEPISTKNVLLRSSPTNDTNNNDIYLRSSEDYLTLTNNELMSSPIIVTNAKSTSNLLSSSKSPNNSLISGALTMTGTGESPRTKRSKSVFFQDLKSNDNSALGHLNHSSEKLKKTTISLIRYDFDQFAFKEFLIPILRLIPSIKNNLEKFNVLENVFKLFKQGGEKLKLYFYEIKVFQYLQTYCQIANNDVTFLKLTLDFIIEYLNYSILNVTKATFSQLGLKGGSIEILANILQFLLVMEKNTYDIVFIQNIQRYILHGVLKYFHEHYLFKELFNQTNNNYSPFSQFSLNNNNTNAPISSGKKDKKKEKKLLNQLNASFIAFCTCAVDYVVQWFDLPIHPPTIDITRKKSLDNSNNITTNNSNNNNTNNNNAEDFVIYSPLRRKTVSNKKQALESRKRKDDLLFTTKNSPPTNQLPSNTLVENVEFITDYMNIKKEDDNKKNNNEPVMSSKINVNERELRMELSANYFYEYECKLMETHFTLQNNLQQGLHYSQQQLLNDALNVNNENNLSEKEDNINNTNNNLNNSDTSSISPFHQSPQDISGFIYWLVESIRKCLRNQQKQKQNNNEEVEYSPISTTEFILIEQLKRVFIYLLDTKRDKSDHIFVLLHLLYFFPFHSELDIHDLLQEPLGQQEMKNCGKFLKSFSSDSKFVTKLLFRTSKFFNNLNSKNDKLLNYLNRKVWKIIITSSKDYLKKNVFVKNKLIDIMEILDDIYNFTTNNNNNNNIGSLLLQPTVIDQVREWESIEFSEFNSKLTSITETILRTEEADKKKELQFQSCLNFEHSTLEINKIKYLKPNMMKVKSMLDSDLQSRKRWKNLIKFTNLDISVFNVYFMTMNHANVKTKSTVTTTRGHITAENDYHQLPFRPYDETSFENVDWKLDSTSGPNRVRMRLKRQNKKRTFEEELSIIEQVHVGTTSPSSSSTTSTTRDSREGNKGEANSGEDQISSIDSVLIENIVNYNYLSIKSIISQPKKCTRITPLRVTEGELILGEDGVYFIAMTSYPLAIRRGGSINTTSSHHRSHTNQLQSEMNKTYNFGYELIREIHNRRYLLKNNALEFFLTNGKSFFFAFEDTDTRDQTLKTLTSPAEFALPNLNLPNLVNYEEEVNGKLIFKKSITQKWAEGTISNFEYLMHLNILAGRSFNDLTQYPVFPYLIRDYDSNELDLSNPNTFRDLRKPMGALNEKRREKFIEKYENTKEIEDQPYHYGSHYSTPIAVSYYLVRLEPFTRVFFEFNDGKLDLADRTFHSIKKAYELSSGETQSKSDVKELIPEFFYLPEFLQNRNRIDFGEMQNQSRFDDIELPTWAKGDPVLFIRKHRQALESDYVSRNLHHWIDLIFGYKQRGEEAIKACNVFHYMTYEGSLTDEVDLIDDPITREARWTQICTYGQTPKQLFKKPHPERYATNNLMGGGNDNINLENQDAISSITNDSILSQQHIIKEQFISPIITPTTMMSANADNISVVSTTDNDTNNINNIDDYTLVVEEAISPNNTFNVGISTSTVVTSTNNNQSILIVPVTNYIFKVANQLSPGNIRIFKEAVADLYIRSETTTQSTSVIAVGKHKIFIPPSGQERKNSPVYLSYRHWDKTLRICKWDSGKALHIFHFMNQPEVYKCCKFSKEGDKLVVGTNRGVLYLFKVNNRVKIHKNTTNTNVKTEKDNKFLDHVATLSGHSDSVLCVAISTEFSLIISGSKDCCMIVWDLNRFRYIRAIKHDGQVTCIAVSPTTGDMASFCQNNKNQQNHLYLWTVNGDLISYCNISAKITCMKFTWMEEGINQNVLICGFENGTIAVLDALSLKPISKLKITDYTSPITCIDINQNMTEIVSGDEQGFVVSWYRK